LRKFKGTSVARSRDKHSPSLNQSQISFYAQSSLESSLVTGPWRDARHLKHFGSESKGDVLPPRVVESDGSIGVPAGLGGETLMVKYPGFE